MELLDFVYACAWVCVCVLHLCNKLYLTFFVQHKYVCACVCVTIFCCVAMCAMPEHAVRSFIGGLMCFAALSLPSTPFIIKTCIFMQWQFGWLRVCGHVVYTRQSVGCSLSCRHSAARYQRCYSLWFFCKQISLVVVLYTTSAHGARVRFTSYFLNK